MNIDFETMAQEKDILKITRENTIIARGIYLPEAVTSFRDDDTSVISYPDTGVFILLKDSHAFSRESKYAPYINSDQKTTREIIFQSRNAAAQFVLGQTGRTNDWK